MSAPAIFIACKGCGARWADPDCTCICSDENDPAYEDWQTVNEYGSPISVHVCDRCGETFTVCPPASPSFGTGCLAEGCPSYDITRDIDLFWNDPTIQIVRTP